jgi:hypothetical protein
VLPHSTLTQPPPPAHGAQLPLPWAHPQRDKADRLYRVAAELRSRTETKYQLTLDPLGRVAMLRRRQLQLLAWTLLIASLDLVRGYAEYMAHRCDLHLVEGEYVMGSLLKPSDKRVLEVSATYMFRMP